jgi:hypothetical protein
MQSLGGCFDEGIGCKKILDDATSGYGVHAYKIVLEQLI